MARSPSLEGPGLVSPTRTKSSKVQPASRPKRQGSRSPAIQLFLYSSPPVSQTLPLLLAFNKPYGVLSQFTSDGSSNRTLAEFGFPKNVYPVGRLDADSEGLLLLSDEPQLNQKLLHPRHAHEREYWVQVERIHSPEYLRKLKP